MVSGCTATSCFIAVVSVNRINALSVKCHFDGVIGHTFASKDLVAYDVHVCRSFLYPA